MISLVAQVARAAPVRGSRRAGLAIVATFDRALRTDRAYAAVVALVMALQYSLIFGHEPWLDEWQALQIALETSSQTELLANLRYEGHPPLWYWLLRGLASAVDPRWVLPWAAAILATACQGLVLLKSPFSRAERVLLALGCFLLFEFMTVSRSLTLGVTVLVVAVALWRTRWFWLAIGLLPLCDFLFGALSGVLLILRWRMCGLWYPGAALWALLAGFSAYSVWPAPDLVPALSSLGRYADISNFLLRSGLLLVPLQWSGAMPAWDGFPPLGIGFLLAVGFYAFAWHELRFDRVDALAFFGFASLTFVFSLTVYPLAARHVMLIALLLILITWLRASNGAAVSSGFRLWLLAGAITGLFVAGVNFAMPFDTAHMAASEIRTKGLASKHWVAFPASRAQGVSALTGIKFENPEAGCLQSFVRWNTPQTVDTPAKLERMLTAKLRERGRFYLLTDLPLRNFPPTLVAPIAAIPAGYDGQAFNLYVVGRYEQERPVALPDCVPGLQPLWPLTPSH